ncbi:MAG: hypothetical protein RIR18_93 [Pseudomonadota bacterium]|jgi:zinc protease
MKKPILIFVALICAMLGLVRSTLAESQFSDLAIYSQTLPNGMRLLVKEDHRSPTVAHMVWYNVGSMDEVDGHSGLAHALEHMMFKGTPKLGPGQFSKQVAAAGGRDNAFTSLDYTAYFQQIPKEKLGEMMALEADRMRHLTVDPKEFAQEIKVVMEERRMRTDDNPQATLFEQLNAVAFQAHPYRRPIIGWMNDLEAMTAADAKRWYQDWYIPNNATLVVVGDVNPAEVFKLAQKTYGALKPRVLPERRQQHEPEQRGVRRLEVSAPAELPVLVMAYKAPSLRKPAEETTPYVLKMLAAILNGHEAARLNQQLVREQGLAVSTGADYDMTSRGPALFYLYGSPSQGKTVEALEAALREQIKQIQESGVTEEELKRAKAQLLASEIFKLDSVFGQAMEIGMLESAGLSWRDQPTLLAGLQAVTADAIQAQAKALFSDASLTVGVLCPTSAAKPPARRPSSPVRH